ncbi:MAG: hypothetical protein CL878_03575 [Dehalococcoidia bacterium]|nr:hypothetical protein [Dehalococcoidia bacterium]
MGDLSLGEALARVLLGNPPDNTTAEPDEAVADPTPCAQCFNAVTYRGDGGALRARCDRGGWADDDVAVARLNAGQVRRWLPVCPLFDPGES